LLHFQPATPHAQVQRLEERFQQFDDKLVSAGKPPALLKAVSLLSTQTQEEFWVRDAS
jgi:hypothetical protein